MARSFHADRQYTPADTLPFISGTNDAPVELIGLHVRVHVTGLFAETEQILTLHNPNARDLEGNLVFPLPEGAVVCGYGIDVDGELVDGVVVPKQEARRILEAEIRKGVDPGLVEHVQGNVYRTRIYPLPARGTRTIKIVYVQPLTVEDNDAAYHLPLGHAEDVDTVSLRVEVTQAPVNPTVVGGLGNLTLQSFESRWVAEARLTEGRPAEDLFVRLPSLPDHVTAVETVGDDTFFCVSSRVADADDQAWEPAHVGVFWDASGSRDDIDRDLAFLQALGESWSQTTYHVRVVRDVIDTETLRFTTTSELVDALRALPCDGATNLSAIDFGDLPHPEISSWLLFSDGLGTIGADLSAAGGRVFTITGQTRNDSALLTHLAQRSAGTHFNLLHTKPEVAARRLAQWSDSLRVERSAGCADVHVQSARGRLTIIGRMTEDIANVLLSGPGAPDDQLGLTKSTATEGRNLARAWAGPQAQLARVLGDDERAVSLGQTYNLVTPGTSLLVLETLEQHLEYDIEPPPTRAQMRADWLDFRRAAAHDEVERVSAQLERVWSMWQERVQWWETDFSQQSPPLQKEKGAHVVGMAAPGGAPAPMPAAAAPEPMMRSRAMADATIEAEMIFEEEVDATYDELAAYEDDDEHDGLAEGADSGAQMKKQGGGGSAAASIQIQPWSPNAPYMTALHSAGSAGGYAAYLTARADYAHSPAFYLDCAHHLLQSDRKVEGLRVLSNLLELALDDPPLLRMYAWRMQQAGELDGAIDILQRVRTMRDDEPQSHRDLALARALRWEQTGDVEDATEAMTLLWEVVKRDWDRFPEIELIALMELNRIIARALEAGIAIPPEIDERFIKLLDLDVRISMSWDADLTDVDLHVFEPTGEHAYYGHNRTAIGGLVSRDFTQGYGPEEYVLRRAQPGDYTIKTHYYGSHQQTIAGPCTVIVNVFTNFGRGDEASQVLTLRLDKASDQELVGTVTIDGSITDKHWKSRFAELQRGMSIDEIIAVVGQPAEIRGSTGTVLVYRPRAGVEVHVTTNPRLESVQQRMDGATLDLLV